MHRLIWFFFEIFIYMYVCRLYLLFNDCTETAQAINLYNVHTLTLPRLATSNQFSSTVENLIIVGEEREKVSLRTSELVAVIRARGKNSNFPMCVMYAGFTKSNVCGKNTSIQNGCLCIINIVEKITHMERICGRVAKLTFSLVF